MTTDHRTHYLDKVRGQLLMVIYPLQLTVDLPIKATSWVAESISFRKTLVRENKDLRQDRLLLNSRLAKFADLEAENNRLRSLLDSSAKIADRVLIAEVLAVDLDPFSRRLVINKGTNNGVIIGQSLIDSNGIMGQVVSVGPISSNALLITDPSHAMPVQLNRNGLRTVAVGTGSLSLLSLSHIPNNSDVRVGDLVVTSGLGGRFPAGYPVGRVISVERDRGQAFAHVTVKPSAHLERNREVLLVWSSNEPDTVESAMPYRRKPRW
jgi:rod shape-determining protein MreC